MINQFTNYVPMNLYNSPEPNKPSILNSREQSIINICLNECGIYGEDRGIILGRIYDKLGIKFEHECFCK